MVESGPAHPAIVAVRASPAGRGLPDPELVDQISLVIDHTALELSEPRRLKKKDPRFSHVPGLTSWAVQARFQTKPGAQEVYRPEIVFAVASPRRWRPFLPRKRLDAETRARLDKLTRAWALRLLGESVGLSWKDGDGFSHAKSGVPATVGFQVARSTPDEVQVMTMH